MSRRKRSKGRSFKGYDEPNSLTIEVIGAAEIATALNNLPHLRSAYFATAKFQTRAEAWESHCRQIAVGTFPLMGRAEDLCSLKSVIDNPEIRVVVIYGPW